MSQIALDHIEEHDKIQLTDREHTITANRVFAGSVQVAAPTEDANPVTLAHLNGAFVRDVLVLTLDEIANKRIALPNVPVASSVEVKSCGVPQYEAVGDFTVMEEAGTWYVSWDGLGMESLVKDGRALEIKFMKA